MLLSACMIVKNEQEMLGSTLPVLSKGVDEIILVDTGSTDDTVKIATEYGCKIYHFPWVNDFSAARNESLKYPGGEWVIWIDADEFIKPEDWAKLREYLKSASEDAYKLEINECFPGEFIGYNSNQRVKIFKNRQGIRFERAINEQLYRPDGSLIEGKLINGIAIFHWGNKTTAEKIERKRDRNIKLLESQIEKYPDDLNYHYLLASNYKEIGRHEEAVGEYTRAIALKPEDDMLAAALTSQAFCLYNLKKAKDAYLAAKEAVKVDPNNAAAYSLIGLILGGAKAFDDAIAILEDALKMDMDRSTSLNKGLHNYKYLPLFYEGIIYQMSGDKEKAIEAFGKACAIESTDEVNAKLKELKSVG